MIVHRNHAYRNSRVQKPFLLSRNVQYAVTIVGTAMIAMSVWCLGVGS